jgi:hypothetical protein
MSYTLRQRSGSNSTNWRTVVSTGYGRFAAAEGHSNDGSESCDAMIWYLNNRGHWKYIAGSTGKGAGHAEMHALSQFVTNICNGDLEVFRSIQAFGDGNSGVLVECESKPCCLYCSAMLGLLGIPPKDSKTKKAPQRMGGTQWGMTSSLRTFMSTASGYPASTLALIDSNT